MVVCPGTSGRPRLDLSGQAVPYATIGSSARMGQLPTNIPLALRPAFETAWGTRAIDRADRTPSCQARSRSLCPSPATPRRRPRLRRRTRHPRCHRGSSPHDWLLLQLWRHPRWQRRRASALVASGHRIPAQRPPRLTQAHPTSACRQDKRFANGNRTIRQRNVQEAGATTTADAGGRKGQLWCRSAR